MRAFTSVTVEVCFLAYLDKLLYEWIAGIKENESYMSNTLELNIIPSSLAHNSDFVAGVRATITFMKDRLHEVKSRKHVYTFRVQYCEDDRVLVTCEGRKPR